jgi:hypothetical protein
MFAVDAQGDSGNTKIGSNWYRTDMVGCPFRVRFEGDIVAKSRKSNDPENPAKVDF